MAGYRVVDIETVPDLRFWDKPKPKLEMEMMGVQVMPNLQVAPQMGLKEVDVFPPPQAHRVVAIATVELSAEDGQWYALTGLQTDCLWSHGRDADELERNLLRDFGCSQAADDATLVTWNGRTFDLPVINLRSFLHGLSCEWYYKERDLRYRYTEACHCDLMDVFTDYGASRAMKLGDVARLLGLPGKTGPVNGAEVSKIYDKGNDDPADMAAVQRYCLQDTLQTALLFAKSRMHKGMIDDDHYRRVVLPSFLPELERHLGVKETDLR